jgi:uncharacterized membrane protein
MEIIKNTERQAEHVTKIAFKDKRLRDKNGNLVPPAVDMLNAYIRHYRIIAKNQAELKLPITHALKCVYMSRRLWNQFEYWYRKMLTEHQSDAKVGMITFLDVEIKKAEKHRPEEIYHECYKSESFTC